MPTSKGTRDFAEQTLTDMTSTSSLSVIKTLKNLETLANEEKMIDTEITVSLSAGPMTITASKRTKNNLDE